VGADPPQLPALEVRLRALAEAATGGRVTAVEPLAGQLGLRRFFRLRVAGVPAATLIARVDRPEDPAGRPAGVPPEPPQEPIRALLEAAGLPVPARFGGDPEAGIDLLEDVGDRSLADIAPGLDAAERRGLYAQACDLVPRLQSVRDPGGVAAFERRLDAALIRYKAELFAEHALGSRPAGGPTAAERRVVREAFECVAAACASAPARLAHRDFQSANLHWTPARGLVMIDLQGAFLAPPEYDLVCLLRDSYVELSPEEAGELARGVRPALPDAPGSEEFAARFDLITLARKGKDVARFLYAASQRGDRRYLRYVPHTLRVLRTAAADAARRDSRLTSFAELCDTLEAPACAP
jgi:hypothetical protein